MSLSNALDQQRAQVEDLIAQAKELQKALGAWQRACRQGSLPAREREAVRAHAAAQALVAPLEEASGSWDFDTQEYLRSGDWRQELIAQAAEAGMPLFEQEECLIASPVIVRANVGREALMLGKRQWSKLHPTEVVGQLQKLRSSNQTTTASQILTALHRVWRREGEPQVLKFRTAYDLFCLTPGWRAQNPELSFVQSIHSLHQAWQREELRTLPNGTPFAFEWGAGDPPQRAFMEFIGEDGRLIRYYGLVFE